MRTAFALWSRLGLVAAMVFACVPAEPVPVAAEPQAGRVARKSPSRSPTAPEAAPETLRVAPVELAVLPVKIARDGATSVPLRLRGVGAESRWVGVQVRVRPALGVALRGLTARRGTESAAAGREVIVAPDVDEPGAFFVTIAALNLDPIPDLDGDGELELATLLPELGPGAAGGGAPLLIDQVVLTDNQPVDMQPSAVVAGDE